MSSGLRVLVTGGVRSGKSRYAEALLRAATEVTYLAAGPVPDPARDPEWAARVEAHRARRPAHWRTAEGPDLTEVLRQAQGAVLLDCLGTWLTGVLDRLDAWESPAPCWQPDYCAQVESLLGAWRGRTGLRVAVTNEVGWGVVPTHASGRLFADLLGILNQQFAAASDEVVLMVAGRPLRL